MKTVTLSLEFVKQAHKAACDDWKRIEEQVPELIDDLDGWYHWSDNLVYYNDGYMTYGFWDGEWRNNLLFSIITYQTTPATDQEVETALIAEAEKRGFKEGCKFIPLHINGRNYCDSETINGCEPFRYDSENWLSNNHYRVFSNGKWAEIISNPIQDKINELQKQLDELKLKLK